MKTFKIFLSIFWILLVEACLFIGLFTQHPALIIISMFAIFAKWVWNMYDKVYKDQ